MKKLKEFIEKTSPHNYPNSAPPIEPADRHLWESKQLYSVIDCLHDSCVVLDFGCGGHGTLQHTLFNHYPNSIYYGLDTDFISHDNYGFIDNKNKSIHPPAEESRGNRISFPLFNEFQA